MFLSHSFDFGAAIVLSLLIFTWPLKKEKCQNIVIPSAGVHVVLPDYYSPRDMGLLDPATRFEIYTAKSLVVASLYFYLPFF